MFAFIYALELIKINEKEKANGIITLLDNAAYEDITPYLNDRLQQYLQYLEEQIEYNSPRNP